MRVIRDPLRAKGTGRFVWVTRRTGYRSGGLGYRVTCKVLWEGGWHAVGGTDSAGTSAQGRRISGVEQEDDDDAEEEWRKFASAAVGINLVSGAGGKGAAEAWRPLAGPEGPRKLEGDRPICICTACLCGGCASCLAMYRSKKGLLRYEYFKCRERIQEN